MARTSLAKQLDIRPPDMLAGLGCAERDLLATCLALFDDSTLTSRLKKRYENASETVKRLCGKEVDDAAREIQSALTRWREGPWTDDDLRLILWIRLREALALPPRLSVTWRGCQYLADDLTAKLIHALDPPGMVNSSKRWLRQQGWLDEGEQATTLGDIVLPVLDELLQNSPNAGDLPSDDGARRRALVQAVTALSQLTEAEQQQLLEDTKANRLNDSAAVKTLLVGGSLGAFGLGVSSAGFSAYILAAQASAFVPFVSGPGLVSFVSVLSNPVTISAVAGGAAWWFTRSARQRIQAAIAARVVAMLTIRGLQAGRSGLEAARQSFARVPHLGSYEGLSRTQKRDYQQEWELVEPSCRSNTAAPPDAILRVMNTPLDSSVPEPGLAAARGAKTTGSESANAAALATLTVGDVLYSAAAVDPTVIRAADFSRLAEIDGRVAFADLAQDILDGSDRAVLGGISQLKGYVAEKAVAAELIAAGHTVSFPDASNAPGWDILVDGQHFQVKFHANLQGIREHFQRYDYPVIANTELQGGIPEEWQDQVFFVDGLSNELVTQVTEHSLEAGEQLLDPGHVSMVGLVSAARGLMAYRSGQLTARQTVEQILLDGAVRAGLFAGGGLAGATAGFMLFGPAGAWVLGAGAPILAQMQTPHVVSLAKEKFRGETHRKWEAAAHGRMDELQRVVFEGLSRKRRQIAGKMAGIPNNHAGDYLRWILADEGRYALECQARARLLDREQWPLPEQRAAELFRWLAACGVHPAIYQPELRMVTETLGDRPGLSELLDREQLAGTWAQVRSGTEEWVRFVADKTEQSGVTGKVKDTLKRVDWSVLRGRKP